MKKRFAVLLPLALIAQVLFFVTPAHAYTCGTDASDNPIETSIKFDDRLCNAGGASPITAILIMIINFMAGGVGAAVIIGIIFGGFMYMTSDGEEAKAKQGRQIIANSIIGAVLFLFMFAAVQFLVPGGVFNSSSPSAPTPPSSPTPRTGERMPAL